MFVLDWRRWNEVINEDSWVMILYRNRETTRNGEITLVTWFRNETNIEWSLEDVEICEIWC